jgi:hypothetical protein
VRWVHRPEGTIMHGSLQRERDLGGDDKSSSPNQKTNGCLDHKIEYAAQSSFDEFGVLKNILFREH